MKAKTLLSRRAFFLTAGAGGVAVAAALAAGRTAEVGSSGKETGKRATKGYHAGAHINNYYRTTKV